MGRIILSIFFVTLLMCGVFAPSSLAAKKLLLYQGNPGAEYVSANVAEIDALPFEGIIFLIPSTGAMRGGAVISVDTFKADLAGMKAAQQQLKKVRHNFVYVRLIKVGPFAGQTASVAQNFANLAEAARDAGLAGIVYDNEDYENDTWAPSITCPGQTVAQCQAAAVAAGKTVMQAVIAKWPDVKFMTYMPPFFSDATIFQQILGIAPEPKHLIEGAYTIGFNEATIGTNATYIEGAEVFGVQSKAKADSDYEKRKVTLPQTSPLIPSAIKTPWAQKVSIGFTVYDRSNGTPAQFKNDITVNLNAADEYVWAYSPYHKWFGPVTAPIVKADATWLAAVKAGRVAAGLPEVPPEVTPTASPSPTPTTVPNSPTTVPPTPTGPSCSQKQGDANHDGQVTLADFAVWRSVFLNPTP